MQCVHPVVSVEALYDKQFETEEPISFGIDREIQCGKRVLRVMHGWLCKDHFIEQARSMPAKPKKPRYMRIPVETDAHVIASILRTDREAITAGTIAEVSYGKHEPAVIRFLQ